MQVDGHDASDVGAGDVDDLVAVEGGDGEAFAVGGGHALEDGLGGVGERAGGRLGVGQGEHLGAERVALGFVGAGKTELDKCIKAAPDGGAGEAGADAELGDSHLRGLRREGLDDDEAAGERGHEVGIAGVDFERDGGGDLGWLGRERERNGG